MGLADAEPFDLDLGRVRGVADAMLMARCRLELLKMTNRCGIGTVGRVWLGLGAVAVGNFASQISGIGGPRCCQQVGDGLPGSK
jgi:hypothetical protein